MTLVTIFFIVFMGAVISAFFTGVLYGTYPEIKIHPAVMLVVTWLLASWLIYILMG